MIKVNDFVTNDEKPFVAMQYGNSVKKQTMKNKKEVVSPIAIAIAIAKATQRMDWDQTKITI